jgi:hypothetical protein
MNKLYKKLSLKTHPDKLKGDNGAFRAVYEAYKTKDILYMMILAQKYDIEVNIESYFITDDFTMFETAIQTILQKIEGIKSTLAWNWVKADDAQKQEYRDKYKF